MKFDFTADGFFMEIFTHNKEGKVVYPHAIKKSNSAQKGLDITLTGRKEDYHIVSIERFIDHLANGDFEEVGRIRMKPIMGEQSNGYAVRKAKMSKNLIEYLELMKK
jgi:hypothetical protein